MLVAILALLINACAELNRAVYSRSSEGETHVIPGRASYTCPEATTQLDLDEVEIKLIPGSSRTSFSIVFCLFVLPIPYPVHSCETEPFKLYVSIRPTKGARLSFDPFQVVLDNGTGPVSPHHVRKYRFERPDSEDERDSSSSKEISEHSGFDLYFPAAVSADESFSIELKGLAMTGRGLSVPVFHFEKATLWSYHVLPLAR
jgi:hypothetical protein